jgi:putative RNA 2'-phosphotransferase
MHAAGMRFYVADNGVWLTEHVPTKFLTVLGAGTKSV